MATLGTPDAIGFMDEVIQYLQDNSTALQAKGLDVTTWITELGTQKNDMVTKDSAEQALKAQLTTAAETKRQAFKIGYGNGSTKLDSAVGALGKTTPEGKRGLKIRSHAIGKSRGKKGTTPPST